MTRLINPDQQYTDNVTGAPLAFGKVYFGEPHQDPETNPKAVYDEEGAALGPVQTLTAAGKFTQPIYTRGDYSITVRDSLGALINSEDSIINLESDVSVSAAGLQSTPSTNDIVVTVSGFYPGSTVGGGTFAWDATRAKSSHNGGTVISPTVPWDGTAAGLSAFLSGTGETDPSGSGCWVRRLNGPLTPKMFGAVGGVEDDTDLTTAISDFAAIDVMLKSGHKNFDFEQDGYYVGTMTTADETFFDLEQQHGLRLLGMPRIYTRNLMTGAIEHNAVFNFIDSSDIEVECHAIGDVFDDTVPQPSGVVAVQLVSSTINASNVRVKARVTRGVAALQTKNSYVKAGKREDADPLYRDIKIDLACDEAKYSCRFINNGFDVVGTINARNATRSYFVVGCKNHNVIVNSTGQRFITDILIKAYEHDVENINVVLNKRSFSSTESAISIEHENYTEQTSIRNVHITVNIEEGVLKNIADIGVSRALGASAINTATACVTDDITININGGLPTGSNYMFRFPSRPNVTGIIRTNRITNLMLESPYVGTNGFTIQNGSRFSAMGLGNPVALPLRIKLDRVVSGTLMIRAMVMSVNDWTGPSVATAAEYMLTGYVLSDGSGVLDAPTQIFRKDTGVGDGTITFTIADHCLQATSSLTGNAPALVVYAEIMSCRGV